MTLFLTALMPVILVVGLGWFLAARSFLHADGWRAIERITYFVLFPALIVNELAKTTFDSNQWKIAASLALAQIAMAVVSIIAARFGVLRASEAGVVLQSNVRFNSFVVLSVASGILGDDGLALAALSIAVMVPLANLLSVWGLIHYAPQNIAPNKSIKYIAISVAKNPLVLACAVGLVLSALGWSPSGFGAASFHVLGQCAIGLGLLTAGAGVSIDAMRAAGRRTFVWSLIRLCGLPAAAIVLGLLFNLDRTSLLIVAIATGGSNRHERLYFGSPARRRCALRRKFDRSTDGDCSAYYGARLSGGALGGRVNYSSKVRVTGAWSDGFSQSRASSWIRRSPARADFFSAGVTQIWSRRRPRLEARQSLAR